jgi:hypothetical protein
VLIKVGRVSIDLWICLFNNILDVLIKVECVCYDLYFFLKKRKIVGLAKMLPGTGAEPQKSEPLKNRSSVYHELEEKKST